MKAVVLSLDAELGWGLHDLDLDQHHRDRIASARAAWRWLVDAFEERSIPATWAVVGHLLLEECDGVHADHPCVDGWFDRDPGGDESTAPDWFGRDLVRAVVESDVDHEIASHSFSHVEFGAQGTTREVADAELRRSVELAGTFDQSVDSFVFPRNDVGHLDLLPEHGIACYRGPAPEQRYERSRVPGLAKAVAFATGRSAHRIVEPRVDERGLVDLPASLYLFAFQGTVGRIVEALRGPPMVRQVRLGLAELRRRDEGILHLWLHPNNLTSPYRFRRMRRILDLLDRHRSEHGIPIRTMGEVAWAVRDGRRPETRHH